MLAPTLPTFTFLHGPSGVGKSTIAKLLLNHVATDPNSVRIYHHAEPIYWVASTLLEGTPIHPTDKEADAWKRKEFEGGMTGREVLIDLGHLFRRARPSIFGDLAVEAVHEYASYGIKHFIFDAVRVGEDVAPIYAAFPSHSALFITIKRLGRDFSHDVGDYFVPIGQFCTDVYIEEGMPDYAISIIRPALAQAALMGKQL